MVKKIFPCFYYSSRLTRGDLQNYNRELIQELQKIREIDLVGQRWSEKNYWGGYTSYGSMDKLHQFSTTFADFQKKLKPHLLQFIKALNWEVEVEDLNLNSLWVNIMPTGTTHSFHIHPLSVISGTYYVQVPKGSSGIQFEDPKHPHMMACPPKKKSTPLSELPHFLHKPVAGEVVLFESWMKHQVPPNPAKTERISLSFNLDWKTR